MSTNYSVIVDGEEVHLGKYVNGAPFLFRGHPERGVKDYASWLVLAASGRIVAEHGVEMTLAEMEEMIVAARRNWRTAGHLYDGQHLDANGNRFSNYEFC